MSTKEHKQPFAKFRKEAGMTIDHVATLFEVDRTTIMRWEKGEPHIPVKRLDDAVRLLPGATKAALRPDIFEGAE